MPSRQRNRKTKQQRERERERRGEKERERETRVRRASMQRHHASFGTATANTRTSFCDLSRSRSPNCVFTCIFVIFLFNTFEFCHCIISLLHYDSCIFQQRRSDQVYIKYVLYYIYFVSHIYLLYFLLHVTYYIS